MNYYYTDRIVLLKNAPLVKFIGNYIRDTSRIFFISSLVRILMTSFPASPRLFVQTVGEKCLYNIRKITRWLEDMNFLVLKTIFYSLTALAIKYCSYHLQIKSISSPCRVISSVLSNPLPHHVHRSK